jgi:hypothetical protein
MLYRAPPIIGFILDTVCGLPGITALGLLLSIGMGLIAARTMMLEALRAGIEPSAGIAAPPGCNRVMGSDFQLAMVRPSIHRTAGNDGFICDSFSAAPE